MCPCAGHSSLQCLTTDCVCRDDAREGVSGGDEALGVRGAAGIPRQQSGAPGGRRHRRMPGPGQGVARQEDGRPHGRRHPYPLLRLRLQGAPPFLSLPNWGAVFPFPHGANSLSVDGREPPRIKRISAPCPIAAMGSVSTLR